MSDDVLARPSARALARLQHAQPTGCTMRDAAEIDDDARGDAADAATPMAADVCTRRNSGAHDRTEREDSMMRRRLLMHTSDER